MNTLITIWVLLTAVAIGDQQCWGPNLADEPRTLDRNQMNNVSNTWKPCPVSGGGQHSMCCRLGPGTQGIDTCEPNGLCKNVDGTGKPIYWRESCTDKTWKDKACIDLFRDRYIDRNTNPDVEVKQCDDNETWCTVEKDDSCCNQGKGSKFINGSWTAVSKLAGSTSTSTTSRPSETLIATGSSAQAANGGANSPQTGPIAGGVVGGVVGVAAIAAAVMFYLRRRNKKRRHASIVESQHFLVKDPMKHISGGPPEYSAPTELPQGQTLHELPLKHQIQELPATRMDSGGR